MTPNIDAQEELNPTSFYSTLYLDNSLPSGNTYHIPAIVMACYDEEAYPALFTEKEILRAVERASKNMYRFDGTMYEPFDKDRMLLEVVDLIDNMSMFTLVKIWFMKKLGIVTESTVRRILDGPQKSTEDS